MLMKIKSTSYTGPINSVIHGYNVIHNNGYAYPFTARTFRTFNNPLLQLVYSTHSSMPRKLVVLDIGAAIGDTALFLLSNCGVAIDKIFCIDGDNEFFGYLSLNSIHDAKIKPVHCFLSDDFKQENSLIRIHASTASSQGASYVDAVTLDYLVFERLKLMYCDVVKIDVDGFDGIVLKGAQKTLSVFKPSVIFEWHPILYNQTQNDYFLPFNILSGLGYEKFVWFNKYGEFSHFNFINDFSNLKYFVDLCLRGNFENDWHYDVVAFHKDSHVDLVEFAELEFAKKKKSAF
jgi:FkbM family methyltransferase